MDNGMIPNMVPINSVSLCMETTVNRVLYLAQLTV